jgi:hypothetical protein
MRPVFYLTLVLCFFSVSAVAQPAYEFTHFSMGGPNSAAFTTNNFKAIAVGKGGLIWAGTQYGGLYTYSSISNLWTKSDKLTNVFINDIKADPDSGIWIAQSGTSAGGSVQSNVAGGVNYFRLATDDIMEFYSVAGTTTEAYLSSRNARSIYLDTAFKAADGELPRPWVALSTYISSSTQRKGGVNVGLNAESPYFSHLFQGLGTASSLICESVGGNSAEVWVGTRLNGLVGDVGSKIVRYTPGKGYIGQYEPSNTPVLQPGFSAQAIFFDSRRNKWIGLKQGGLRILRSNGEWAAMNSSQFFDAGTQVNYNAIAEDEFGNIYIGTTGGLLMYESPKYATNSNPDLPSNYKLFTTLNGLLNNNVTGLAYDKKNGKLLITSAGGVSFLKIKYPNIHGMALNVYTNIENASIAGLIREPFTVLGRVKAYLIKDGVEQEMVLPEADGSFELKEADETSVYSVEVRHNLPGKTIRYIYNNIKKHTRLEPSLIPDSLIGEIEAIIPKLKKRCFPVKLTFGIEVPELICTAEGFFTNGYAAAYDWVYDLAGVSSDHQKHVDNLANYYAGLSAVYNLGGQSADLISEASGSLLDAIESMAGEFQAKKAVKNADVDDLLGAAGEENFEQLFESSIKLVTSFKESLVYVLNKTLVFVKNEDVKKLMEKLISAVSEAADLIIESEKGGSADAVKKAIKDNIKRIIAQILTTIYYDQMYAQDRHAYFVPQTSLAAHNIRSTVSYEEAFERLYSASATAPSLVKQATGIVTAKKANMTTLVNGSKLADGVNAMADLVSVLAVIPGGQAIAAAARAVAVASKAFKYLLLGGAVFEGANGAIDVAVLSDSIQMKTALERYYLPEHTSYSNVVVETTIDSLMAKKNRYNQKLTELQPIYAAGSFDINAFKVKRSQLKVEDSLYSAELKNVMNSIVSVADTAGDVIGNFTERYDNVVDSFINYQSVLKKAYYFRNLAYIAESNKDLDKAGIDSLITSLKVTNDSIVNGLQNLLNDLENNNILSKAFLLQENYSINYSRIPGDNGSVSYSFKNYGGEPQNNVSFKITDVEGGYTILGADSIHAGTILPGETKTVIFNFTSPMHDSMSHYRIAVKASNGRYQDASGSFYAIDPAKCYSLKDGNWNDPTVWSCNQVPGLTSPVYIIHKITVTANAACKNVTIGSPGDLKINNGMNFQVAE